MGVPWPAWQGMGRGANASGNAEKRMEAPWQGMGRGANAPGNV